MVAFSFSLVNSASLKHRIRHTNITFKLQKTLDWTPWLFYKAQRIGSNVLAGIDNTGEKLADFFGITSPKYAYEIRQYQKEQAMKAEDEKVEKDNTWEVSKDSSYSEPITSPPSQSRVLEV